MSTLLEAQGLAFRYPGGFRLEEASLALRAGACLRITGGNGSGKTTLGRLLCGLLRPENGCALLLGKAVEGRPLDEVGRSLGYLMQEPERQLFAPTPLEELTFAPLLRGEGEGGVMQRGRAWLARFGIEALWDAPMLHLSRGEKQRVALAALLIGAPRVLVLDEPTTALDGRSKVILDEVLREHMAAGGGVLLISHEVGFLPDAPIRRMEGGRLV